MSLSYFRRRGGKVWFSVCGGALMVGMGQLGLSSSQSKGTQNYREGFGDAGACLPLFLGAVNLCGCALCRSSQQTIDCEGQCRTWGGRNTVSSSRASRLPMRFLLQGQGSMNRGHKRVRIL